MLVLIGLRSIIGPTYCLGYWLGALLQAHLGMLYTRMLGLHSSV